MTPTNPSPISDQAAGDNQIACSDCGLTMGESLLLYRIKQGELTVSSTAPTADHSAIYISKRLTGSDADASFVQAHINQAVSEAMERSTATTTGSASLRSDEWADSLSPQWKTVVAASASPAVSVPVSISDTQILEAFEASGVQWQSVRTLANDHEYMTYGSQPAKNLIAGVRALLTRPAASMLNRSAFSDIVNERIRQTEQWGGAENDDRNTMTDWQNQIYRQHHKSSSFSATPADYRERFVKMAALAIAAIESIDRAALLAASMGGGKA